MRIALFLFILACIPSSVFAGFGVSPSTIEEDRLVPGATITRTLYLVQGDPDEDVIITVAVESRDAKDWITIVGGNSFTIPAGTQQYPMTVSIAVPADVELGRYTAFVRAQKAPAQSAEEDGQVAIAEGVRADIELTVGDDIIEEYSVRSIEILDIAEGDDIHVEATIVNAGNVPTGPTNATFELFDKFDNIRLGFANVDADAFAEIPAFTEEKVQLMFPVGLALGVGEYWGHVRIMDETGEQRGELKTVFNVVDRDELITQTATDSGATTEMSWLVWLIVFVVIVITGVLLARRTRRTTLTDTQPDDVETERPRI